jgi:NTE family protein
LALGSGGARGIAHMGVIRAFEEAGIRVEAVAGASMGALVGLGRAAGRLGVMRDVVLNLDWKKALRYFVEARVPRSGLIDGARVLALIRMIAGGRTLDGLDIPCAAVATDLASGDEVVFQRGEAETAIRASIAVPGLFTPVRWENRLLADGALVNPVPVSVARRLGAAPVVAVDVAHFQPLMPEQMAGRRPVRRPATPAMKRIRERADRATRAWRNAASRSFLAPMLKAIEAWEREPGMLDVLGIALRIMESQIAETRFRLEPPDLLIRPDLGSVFFMEFHRAAEIEEAGYRAGKAALPRLAQLDAGNAASDQG